MSDEMTATRKFLAFVNSLRPCNKAMQAVEANIAATKDFQSAVARFDKSIEKLVPVLEKAVDQHKAENND